ncbi:MAG TPA: hypothetical protein VN901_02510 [Candidatus Acidoferrales bacterium]|nr:hypothetical protein [Candidatus Acidoferrales bacterium]
MAFFTDASDFQTNRANLEAAPCGHFSLQFLKQIARKLHDGTALKAGHVAMIMVGFDFVIVLLALDMHQVQLIDQATALQQVDRAIDRRAIDTRIFFSGKLEQGRCVEMPGRILDNADDQPPLFRDAYTARRQLIHQGRSRYFPLTANPA